MSPIYHVIIGTIACTVIPVLCHVPFSQPGFLSSPTYIEGDLNETVLIPCMVHDLGKNVLRWWKDGTLLSDSSDDTLMTPPRITLLTNNMLLVDWLEPGDSGNYTCEIIRAYPRMPIEQVHTVRVRYPPKIITVPADGYLETVLGNEVQMGCMASGWPTPTVTWKFKDEIMKSLDNRHKLTFMADDASKSGVYQCEADNGINKPAFASILLKILYPPDVRVEKTWVHSTPGMKTEIECMITAEPRPKVEWFFEEQPLEFDSSRMTYRVRGNKHVLTIRSVLDTDFGAYVCKASNKIGQVQRTVELSGRAYPAVFKRNRDIVTPDGYNLVWEVDSYSPIIEYRLLFKEINADRDWIQLIIPADTDSSGPLHSKSYTLSGLKSTVYKAQLFSRNRFGWSEPSKIIKFGIDGISDFVDDEIKPITREIKTAASSACCMLETFTLLMVTCMPRIVAALIQTFPVNL